MKIQSPKEKLLADKERAGKHQRIASDNDFIAATDTALLQYLEQLGDSNDPVALPNYYRLQGAKAYRRLLLNLADLPEAPRTQGRESLDPNAETYIAPRRDRPAPTPPKPSPMP